MPQTIQKSGQMLALGAVAIVAATLLGCSAGSAGDATPPAVSLTNPADGAVNVGAQDPVSVTLSEALDCDSLASNAVTVSEGDATVSGTTTCSGVTLTFTAASGLPTRATLTAVVSTAVRDLHGNHLQAEYQWQFSVLPWTKQTGTAADDTFNSVAVDSAGNVYAVGESSGSFLGHSNVGLSDATVVKYDRFGTVQWAVTLGTSGNDSAKAVAVDESGNVYVGGTTEGDLGDPIGNTSTDAFVAKLNNSGERQWLKQLHSVALPSAGYDFLRGLAVDPSGNVVVSGYTDGSLFATFQGGASELFIAKFDAGGDLAWGYQAGTGLIADAAAVALDASGNVFATGYAQGGLDGNADTGNQDAFVTKLSPAGIRQWTTQFGTSGTEFMSAIALDANGDILVAGRTDSSIGGQLNAGRFDALVAKIGPSGQLLWTSLIGSAADDIPTGIAVDASGDMVVAGHTFGNLSTFVNAGGGDGFAFKLDTQGSPVWVRQWGTNGQEVVAEVALDGDGAALVAGWTSGSFDGISNAGGLDALIVKIDPSGTMR